MKKSEVIYDLEQIICRLDALKVASCLKTSQAEVEDIKTTSTLLKTK